MDKNGTPMFSEGYPPRKDIPMELEPEVLDEPDPVNGVDASEVLV